MATVFLLWAIALAIFVGIDLIWLMWLGRGFYVSEIGGLLREKPNLPAAAIFYCLYAAGLVVFILKPALAEANIHPAVLTGAFFGLVAYGTYDLTSLAVLKGFTAKIALIDMTWGALLTAITTALTLIVSRLLWAQNLQP